MHSVDLNRPAHSHEDRARSEHGRVDPNLALVHSIDEVAAGVDMAVGITSSRIRADGELRRELLQEGWVAALEVAPAFDRSVGVSFIDYLRSHLRWRLLNYLRHERRRNHSAKLMALENARKGSRRFDPAAMIGPELRSAIRRLPPRQRSVIAAKYVEGRRTSEIAASLGISRQMVARHLRRARESLRQDLVEETSAKL